MAYDVRELRLVKPLSSGDLATVYLATDPKLRNVSRAVSIFHPDVADLEDIVRRISERARRARRIKHPGVAQSEGVYTVSGQLALVGEAVDGKDLERLSKRQAIPGPVAARIGAEVVAVLLAAKEEGLMHGLLGPRRIRINSIGQIRVHGLGDEAGVTLDTSDALFREDRGTRRYAAPELVGGMLTSSADVYALGAILTRMISGRWPKRASAHASGQASVAEGASTVVSHAGASHALSDLIKDCMGFRSDLRPYLDEAHTILSAEAIDNAGWSAWLNETVLSYSDHSESSESGDFAATDLNEPGDVVATELIEPEPSPESDSVASDPVRSVEPARIEIPVDASNAEGSAPAPLSSEAPTLLEEPAPILGTLPPPNTEEVMRPLAVAGDVLTEEDTECTADPDTVDEPTEEVTKEIKAQIDEDADDWDRMLGLDLKADDKLDQEWIRAARGESEYQRFVVWGAIAIFIGILGAWKLGAFDGVDAPTETAPASAPPVAPDAAPEPPAQPEVEFEALIEPEVPTEVEPPVDPEPAETAPAEPPAETVAASPRSPKAAETPAKPVPASVPPPPEPPAPPPPPVEPPSPPPAVESVPSVSTAAFRVTGDAHEVRLVKGSQTHTGGRVPPGSYTIQVVFRPGDAPQNQGVLTLEAGESAIVNCKGSFYRCTIRGPWK